uniref:Calbindin 2b n=2 Tax=Cyprinus carpio TaxID=7962 RepID=A0A8C0Y3T3_CYPCA
MANKAAEPLPLHLAELTATQFLDIWNKFDADGNGCIEGKELEHFIRELELARKSASDPSNASFKDRMKEFMQKFDENGDGKIEMSELAQILPTEENFLLCFRQFVGSSAEFMAAWRKYDTDRMDTQFTQTHIYTLKMFDLNGDGKLGLSEMARLLPVQENFLLKFQNFKLSAEEFEAIFTYYDKDGNGFIDEHELDALLRDLYQKQKMVIDPQKLASSKKSIMALSDGGKLFRTELEIVLCKDPSV